jgi:hypothetical protein
MLSEFAGLFMWRASQSAQSMLATVSRFVRSRTSPPPPNTSMHGFEHEGDAPLLLHLFGKSDVELVTVFMGLRLIWLHGFLDFIAASVDARHSAEIRDMKVTR